MVVKKTFRITELRNSQLEIMQSFLISKGFKGTQTEIVEKAIMEMYFSMRRTDYDWFEQKEKEKYGFDEENESLNKKIREVNGDVS